MTTAKYKMERIAREFWATTKSEFRFNYDIINVVESALNVQLIRMPQLCPIKINSWLNSQHMDLQIENKGQNLHGALLIQNGTVLMFIDTTENATWQRYTLAHQVSRFLLEYQMPREQAILTLGKEIAGVLKGNDDASVTELVQSAFNDVSNKAYTLLIEKKENSAASYQEPSLTDNPADFLALELLAPRYQIIQETASKSVFLSYAGFKRKCRELLIGKYRIPTEIAHKYACELAGSVTNGPSFFSRFGF